MSASAVQAKSNRAWKLYFTGGYTHELVRAQVTENFYFHGRSSIEDLGSNYRALCHKANELNRLDWPWGIYYYVREIQ
jgi:hypothetical protein